MSLFDKYVDWAGGPEKAAESVGYTSQYIYLVRCGSKPMTKKLAEKIHEHSNGKFNKIKLLWGE